MKHFALLIGGVDSSAGAGLLRDADTLSALDVPFRLVVTAVTAQSDAQVRAVHLLSPEMLMAQMAMACTMPIASVKIGMLGSRAGIETIARALPDVPLVVDPVLVSSSGGDLLDREGLDALIEQLLPKATLLTPNMPELHALAMAMGLPQRSDEHDIVRALQVQGCSSVLVKGGHAKEAHTSEDKLYLPDGSVRTFQSLRFPFDLRGTGCQLASAIAAYLALGETLAHAVEQAKRQVTARFERSAMNNRRHAILR